MSTKKVPTAAAGAPTKSAADKKAIKLLTQKDVTLTGDETSEDLAALMATHFPEVEEEGAGDEIVLAGVPNSVPQVYEPQEAGNKGKKFALFQVVAVKGGHALYNQRGQRVSPVCSASRVHGRDADIADKQPGEVSEYAYIAKACARMNAERRAARLPGDPQE